MSDLSPEQHIDALEEVIEILDDRSSNGHGDTKRRASVLYAIRLIRQQMTNIEAYYVCHQRSGRDFYCDVYEVAKEDFDKLYPFKDSFESTRGTIPFDIKELSSDCCTEEVDFTQAQIDDIPDDHWILVTDY